MRSAMRKAESISCVTTTLVTPSFVQVDDELIDFGAGDGIEAGRGFIVKENRRIERDGAGEAGAFFHSAGEHRGHSCRHAGAGRPVPA
jgi:hypothetical protein